MPVALVAIPILLFAAIGVLLLLWATDSMVRRPLMAVFGSIPVIGGQVADSIGGALMWLVNHADVWARTAIGPLVQLTWVPTNALWDLAGSLIDALEAIPPWINAVVTNIGGDVADAAKTAAIAISRIAAVAARIAGVVADLADTAARVAHIIATLIPNAIGDLRDQLIARIAQAIDRADVRLGQAIDNLRDWTLGRITDALRPISAELAHLGDLLGGLRTDLNGWVRTITGLLTPILALSLPIAWPLLITRIDTMERECVDPMCGVITPQIPTLTALGDLATLLLVGALVGEAVHDPEGAARVVAGAVGGIHDGASGLAGAFAGIRV